MQTVTNIPPPTKPLSETVVPQAAARTAPPRLRSPFVPLLLGGLALAATLGLQVGSLMQDRQALQSAHASQQQVVDNATKLRASLDALAADTQRLADAGNANARLLVEELKKRGVTINPAAPPTPAATPAR